MSAGVAALVGGDTGASIAEVVLHVARESMDAPEQSPMHVQLVASDVPATCRSIARVLRQPPTTLPPTSVRRSKVSPF